MIFKFNNEYKLVAWKVFLSFLHLEEFTHLKFLSRLHFVRYKGKAIQNLIYFKIHSQLLFLFDTDYFYMNGHYIFS